MRVTLCEGEFTAILLASYTREAEEDKEEAEKQNQKQKKEEEGEKKV